MSGVEDGVIDREADVAVVEGASTTAVVAEGLGLREGGSGAVVDAAVDEESIGGAAAQVVVGRFSGGRLRRGVLRLIGLGWGAAGGLELKTSGGCRAGCVEFDDLRLHVSHGEHGKFEVLAGGDFFGDFGEAGHIDFELPGTVSEIRELVGALRVGD